jgi:hypothetical protein
VIDPVWWPEAVGWALFGGLMAEFVGIFELRHKVSHELPHWFGSTFYWLTVVGMVLAGGVLVLAYLRSGMSLNALLAVNVGASAPLALRQVVSAAPRLPVPSDPRAVN